MTDNSLHQNSSQSSSKPQNGIKGTLIEPTADRPFTSVRFGSPKPAAPAKKDEAKTEQPQNGVKGTLIEPTAERPFVSVRFGASRAPQDDPDEHLKMSFVKDHTEENFAYWDEYLGGEEGQARLDGMMDAWDEQLGKMKQPKHIRTEIEVAPDGGVNIKVFFRYNGSDCVASLHHSGCASSGD